MATQRSPSTATALPRRDRIAVLAALGGVTALAWIYLVAMAAALAAMAPAAPAEMLKTGAYSPE
jgi:predicted metal-binding membrane protein